MQFEYLQQEVKLFFENHNNEDQMTSSDCEDEFVSFHNSVPSVFEFEATSNKSDIVGTSSTCSSWFESSDDSIYVQMESTSSSETNSDLEDEPSSDNSTNRNDDDYLIQFEDQSHHHHHHNGELHLHHSIKMAANSKKPFHLPTNALGIRDVVIKKTTSKKEGSARPKIQMRPKVVESKGTIQCQGINRKKGTQCRNAALMEYIGPRPTMCAEHVNCDPTSLYQKCKTMIPQPNGQLKQCKEVVLRQFGICFKHVSQDLVDMTSEQIEDLYSRVHAIKVQLEMEAADAKINDPELYQRKNKLLPKYVDMVNIISQYL